MGRAAVRTAMQSYFSGASIYGVGKVYRARRKNIPGPAYDTDATGGSGAVVIIHLTNDRETRKALGGVAGGKKTDVHSVTLEVRFKSLKPDAEEAQDDHDAVMDGIVAAIRADRTLGCGYDPATNQPSGPIWQAGEGSAGIRVSMGEPAEDGQVIKIMARVVFEVWEWVTA